MKKRGTKTIRDNASWGDCKDCNVFFYNNGGKRKFCPCCVKKRSYESQSRTLARANKFKLPMEAKK